jgi:dTDP-4-dehydrorhamnose reductase
MRILLLGARGQVGYELAGALAPFATVTASSRTDTTLEAKHVATLVDSARPDVIVNATAYTDVDGAERDPDAARAVNTQLVAALGEDRVLY